VRSKKNRFPSGSFLRKKSAELSDFVCSFSSLGFLRFQIHPSLLTLSSRQLSQGAELIFRQMEKNAVLNVPPQLRHKPWKFLLRKAQFGLKQKSKAE